MKTIWRMFVVLLALIIYSVQCSTETDRVQPEQSPSKDAASATNQKESPLTDSVAENDEHHKVVILVPQVVKPMSKPHHHHHHHGKHIPVIHSGKVVHTHHHDGKVSHQHGHVGKTNHNHKHLASVGHKHNHHGVGIHKHAHTGKGLHAHKHYAHADHLHKHHAKASHNHKHHGHASHDHKHRGSYGGGGHGHDHGHGHHGHGHGHGHGVGKSGGGGGKYFNVGSKVIKIVHPGSSFYDTDGELLSGIITADKSNGNGGKLIQIRIPDDLDNSIVKEIDIDTDTDIAVVKNKYIEAGFNDNNNNNNNPDDEYESLTSSIADYLTTLNDDEDEYAPDDHSPDGTTDTGYRFGEGYRLAAAAAAEANAQAGHDDQSVKYPFDNDDDDRGKGGFVPIVPKLGGPSPPYSDSYHVQY